MLFILAHAVLLTAEDNDTLEQKKFSSPRVTLNENGTLLLDGKPLRAVGINYFSAFSRRLENPDNTSYREGFAELKKRGIPFVRFMACGFWPKEWQLYLENKEAYFCLLDDVISAAEKVDMGLIPSLFWYNATIPDLVKEPRNQWGNPDSRTISLMRQYTKEVVTRYRNSPAIWAWEFGNEYSLEADLPNAAEHRPWVYPTLGTPEQRTEADDLTHNMIVTAVRIFAEEVRKYDPIRPITTGHSLPRPAAEHLRLYKEWTQDTHEEFRRNLLDVTPSPCNLISIHVYPFDRHNRFRKKLISYEEILQESLKAAKASQKGLFIGEFGAQDDEPNGGPRRARAEIFAQLAAIERTGVQLAALWNYDLPSQEADINISLTNHRSYLLDVLGQTNRRLCVLASGNHFAELASTSFNGRLLDNLANQDRQGSGFNPLFHHLYPGENIFRGDAVGLNFEHIFNGIQADSERCMFTPRQDNCQIIDVSSHSATLFWPAEHSQWGFECRMTYTLKDNDCLDIHFQCTPTRNEFPLGYAALMWASYINHARDRKIYFYGLNNKEEGWITFGEDTEYGFETGTISYIDVPPLPYEEGAQTLNIKESQTKHFLLPFYYGLLDGDGDLNSTEDTLAYVMMFDQTEPIRFAMWNFILGPDGKPDTHSPAWDWQYIIKNPQPGKTYSYYARLLITPFENAEKIQAAYDAWIKSRTLTEK